MARTIARDHDAKRRMILKTAAKVFASEGYGRASMSAVAAACGVSKANIYHYYDSKDALLFDILDAHLSVLRDRVCNLVHASDDPARQLQTIITELLLAYDGADAEHAVQLNAMAALPERERETLKVYQRDLVREVRARVARLVPRRVANDSTELRALTMSIFALVNWHCQWDGRATTEERRTYAELVSRWAIEGLRTMR